MALESKSAKMDSFDSSSFVTSKHVLNLLEKRDQFKGDLKDVFAIKDDDVEIIKIGNASNLIADIHELDSKFEKIDIESKINKVNLYKLLNDEKAIFEITSIDNNFILLKNKSDILLPETRYNAKNDLLDYYNFSKFANYCREKDFDSLVDTIKEYLKIKNIDNKDEISLRLIYSYKEKEFYIRAITSNDYRDFGINFSAFVAIMSLGRYVEKSKNEIFIDNYKITDSDLYISFSMKNNVKINKDISLSFNLILENDEIKRNSVSFNGVFKLQYSDESKNSHIYIRPKGIKKSENNYPVDLLSFPHRGKVDNVFEKMKDLPDLIDHFIAQVSEDAKRISEIKNPDDVRKLISDKIKNSKKVEFKVYKDTVFKKLMSINVDNVFKLFELLREVEDLFEHDDVISRNFWRSKLYESLIERQ